MYRVAIAVFFGMMLGCSDRTDHRRYYPPEDKARHALETALSAWQRGLPAGEIPGTANPVVTVVDNQRAPAQRLKAFEILTVVPGDGPRVLTVRLTLENPSAEVKVRYIVVGADPLWVFRQEDYDMLMHWDHPMPKTQ